MALAVSSHVCRDRRARGSFHLPWTKEVGQIWRPVVGDDELFEATSGAEVQVCDMWERCSGVRIEQHVAEQFLDVPGGRVCRVEGHRKEQGVVGGG